MKKNMFKTICLVVLTILVIGIMSGVVFAENMTLYINWARDDAQKLVNKFEKSYPDVDVQIFRAPIEELMTIVQMELKVGVCRADYLLVGAPERAMQLKEAGYFLPYYPTDVKYFNQSFLDKDEMLLPVSLIPMMIQYNTNHISVEEAPKSWADLLDKKWDGKLVIADPRLTGSVHAPIWFITKYLEREYGEPYGWDFFKELFKLNPMIVGGHRKIRDMVVIGERILAAEQSLDHIVSAMKEGEPASYVSPEEGAPTFYQVGAILKDAKNPEAAKMFVDWLASKDGAAALNDNGFPSLRTDVRFEMPDGKSLTDFKLIPVDYQELTPELKNEQAEKFFEILNAK